MRLIYNMVITCTIFVPIFVPSNRVRQDVCLKPASQLVGKVRNDSA